MSNLLDLRWNTVTPEPTEYLDLRAACGLTPRSAAAAERALPQSLFTVTARASSHSTRGATPGARGGGADNGGAGVCNGNDGADTTDLVAMGRVVGDGGCFFQVVDVMVHPEFQGRGLGAEVMRRTMAYLAEAADETAHINLFAAPRAVRLYERFGFAPSEPACIGMDLPRPGEAPPRGAAERPQGSARRAQAPRPAPGAATASLAAFEHLDMRVGTVTAAEEFPEARKPAYKLTIDFGDYSLRSSARITKLYGLADLRGRQVICAVNLGERQIGPFVSQCLVLGIEDHEGGVTLLEPERPVENGRRIS